MTALEQLKIRLDLSTAEQDDKLTLMLSEAKDTILDLIGREELPSRLISVQVQLAIIAYNKQGAEGETSRSEGGVSQGLLDGLPDDLKKRLASYPRKVGVICEVKAKQA